MPHVDTEPTTHYPGCWREHHECAIKLIEHTRVLMEDLIMSVPTVRYIAWLEWEGAFAKPTSAKHADKDGAAA